MALQREVRDERIYQRAAPVADLERRTSGTGSSNAPSRGSCSPSRRSTSPPIAGQPAHRPGDAWATRCLWKPASTLDLLLELVPDAVAARKPGCRTGVINFVPGSGGQVGDPVHRQRSPPGRGPLHRLHRAVFQGIWSPRRHQHRALPDSYPRVVGETGGKDFVFAHRLGGPGRPRWSPP